VITPAPRANFRAAVFDPSRSIASADKGDTTLCAGASARGILSQESVSRMKRVASRVSRHADDFFDYQIALPRGRRADWIGFVGDTDVQRSAVGVAKHRYGTRADVPACAHQAYGNLTAIGNQDFAEHFSGSTQA
jgi:hypothetical protein